MDTVKKSFPDLTEQDITRWKEAHPATAAFYQWLSELKAQGLEETWSSSRTGNHHVAAVNAGRTEAFAYILSLFDRKDEHREEQSEEYFEDQATRPSLRRKS